jgi:hypothetical protein
MCLAFMDDPAFYQRISEDRQERKLICEELAASPASLRSSRYLQWCSPRVVALRQVQEPRLPLHLKLLL